MLLPAHAGVIPQRQSLFVTCVATPRTCGGDPELQALFSSLLTYSPHMRG